MGDDGRAIEAGAGAVSWVVSGIWKYIDIESLVVF